MPATDNLAIADTDAGAQSAVRAAQAIVTLLPASSDLTVGAPHAPGLVHAADWPGAAVADLSGRTAASVGVLVGAELVAALAQSPMGPLELGAAIQPTLDAAAVALGATASAARTLDASDVPVALASASTAVPLLSDGDIVAILLVTGETPSAVSSAPSQPARGDLAGRPGIELLHGVAMDVTVELGRTRLSVRELLALTPGDVIELDRAAGSPADLLVNGRLIARGEVVVIDENFALRITEIVTNPVAN